MTEVAVASPVDKTNFDAATSRDGWIKFVQGLPEEFVPPQDEVIKHTESDPTEDREEHLHMLPPCGTHVPGVLRYPSGFRNWYDTRPSE